MIVFTVLGIVWSGVILAVGALALGLYVLEQIEKRRRRRAGPTNLRLVRDERVPRTRFGR